MPFCLALGREFHRRGIQLNWSNHRAFGRGSWVLAPRNSRAVLFAGPAMAFVHRAGRIHLPLLPWDFCLSQVFTFGLRPPLLGPFRPGFSSGAMDVFASDPVTSKSQACPSALSGADG
jgi:hypothetical protein